MLKELFGRAGCCLGLALLAFAPAAPAQTATAGLRGWVVDTAGQPVAGAQLQIVGTAFRANVLPDGSFRLDRLPPGRHILLTRAIGFRPDQRSVLIERLDDTLRIRLVPVPQQLDEIVVTPEDELYQARMRGFVFRTQTIRRGRLFREEEIQRQGRNGLGNLLAHHFEVSPAAFNAPGGMSNSRVRSDCAPGLAVNGGEIEIGVPISRYKAEEIEAIEAYPAGNLPMEYVGRWTRCGLVILWLKNYVPPGLDRKSARR